MYTLLQPSKATYILLHLCPTILLRSTCTAHRSAMTLQLTASNTPYRPAAYHCTLLLASVADMPCCCFS